MMPSNPTPEQLIAEARAHECGYLKPCRDKWPDKLFVWCSECIKLSLAAALASALKERDEALSILKAACDREWKDETLMQAATIASNAIYWRQQHIADLYKARDLAQQRIEELEAVERTLDADLAHDLTLIEGYQQRIQQLEHERDTP